MILAVRQRRVIKERKKFYRDNGGLLLESRLSQHRSYVESLKVFSVEDLQKATDNYDESRILGEGGQGTVYKGTVMNNKAVAIKKAKILDRSQTNEFINEVIILSQINHKNVVKLIGCCLETEMPLLVYEFITNGTLFGHLHGKKEDSALSSWSGRLRIAAETAVALSYLHTDAGTQIIHRDVKRTNILLDENYTVKVSDFGASRLMPSDHTQLTTLVQGTLGYLDPEYLHSGQLTDKSDVYSFSIVLAELLTGMQAISFDKPEKERYLSSVLVSAVKEDRCLEIIDCAILNEDNGRQIEEVALLASKCLGVRGEERPSMKEVALELEGLLRATSVHPWEQQGSDNPQESEHLLGSLHGNYSDTISANATVVGFLCR
ncbi:hypothetical protein SAY87_006325 [Trapa incisa]|uniref:Protein kinase domain-containing protein n=1 Tax=Trapa incisa TaxID=236973 RepID=A0AAN7PYW9_9MYRT|nr:hypothetical protein SAY87_006325 [Trapa incisa]